MIKKTTRIEAKTNIQVSVSCHTNQHCQQGSQPMHITAAKANSQSQITKVFQAKEFKPQGPKSSITLPCYNNLEARQEKKKIAVNITSNNGNKKAQLRPAKSIQPSQVKPIKKKK